MRIFSTIALFSATVIATNHGSWNEGMGHYGKYDPQSQPSPQPVNEYVPKADTTTVMMHETTPAAVQEPPMMHETTTVMMHETSPAAVEEPPMMHETTTVMVHESTPAAVEEPPMMHTSTMMMHDITTVEAPMHTTPPKQELEVSPPVAGPMTHTVIVGGDAGLVYTPSEIKAAVGDIVHFVFHKQNHSVTQSTFDKPCNKLETGEDSGLLPNPNNTITPAPTWAYTVKEDTPTWWYCKQRTGTHCGKGMVFAINPTVEKTFNMFKEKAIMLNGTAAITTTAPAATVTEVATTVTLISEPSVTSPPEKVAPPSETIAPPYTAPGWNENGNNACNCACFCGVGSFPKGDGWGHYGGVGGSLTAPW